MATSIVARGYLSSTFFSIFVLVFVALTSAQSISSTNDTLPTQETDSALLLQLQGSPLFINKAYVIVPLTVAAGKGQNTVALSAYNIQGSVSFGDSLNQGITDPDIAIICCDSTDSINATESVNLVTHKNPQAIVLYSVHEDACSLTGNFGYQSIYSLTSLNDSEDLLTTLSSYSSNSQVKAVIYSNTTTFRDAPGIDNSNEGGPAPTTAVAMSILYSITGIITLLFLIIIATGAIRAHRHPERYGPRGAGYPGRQRQSLAKGLAKAMLETLPIIKFGDPVPPKSSSEHKYENQVPIKGDTECIIADRSIHTDLENYDKKTSTIEEGRTEKMGPILVNSLKDENDTLESDLGCSICTEDFKTGEDLRVLPCDHKFHPACVDPWLLNVCGTCPLCRFDLRPASDRGVNSQEQDISPPLAMFDTNGYIANGTSNPQRSRISRFFDINLLRHASPDDSIAVLRQLRQQIPAENLVANPENPEERSRRSWLTKRLKEVFRIKTRTQTRNISSSV